VQDDPPVATVGASGQEDYVGRLLHDLLEFAQGHVVGVDGQDTSAGAQGGPFGCLRCQLRHQANGDDPQATCGAAAGQLIGERTGLLAQRIRQPAQGFHQADGDVRLGCGNSLSLGDDLLCSQVNDDQLGVGAAEINQQGWLFCSHNLSYLSRSHTKTMAPPICTSRGEAR
jgi:hypothetical protein